jgi:PAS domain S-box-containing protein
MASGPQKVTLQLKWTHGFQFAGYYAAQQQGYYAAEGLEVSLQEGRPDRLALPMVQSGAAEFGVSGMEVFQAYEQGEPLVALGVVFQHSPYVLISLKAAGIKRPKDLVGRRVMFAGNQGKAEAFAMLKAEGIAPEALQIVTPAWDLNELLQGRVDVLSAYATDEPHTLRLRGAELNLLHPRDYGVDFYGDLLFTTQGYVEAHPGTVQAFRRASLRGWEYAMNNPEAMITAILQMPGVDQGPSSRQHLQFEADQMKELVLPGLVETGHMNPGRFQRMADIYRQLGMIQTVRNPEDFLWGPPRPLATLWIPRLGLLLGVLAFISLLVVLWIQQLRHRVQKQTTDLREEVVHRREAEARLAEREQRLRVLVENLPAGAIYEDEAGFFINARMAELMDRPQEELVTLEAWLGALDPKDGQRLREAYESKRDTHPVAPLLVHFTTGKGARRTLEVRMRTLPYCEIWMALDVTAREAAEAARRQSEDRYRGLYQNSSDMIFLVQVEADGSFRFEGINPAYCATYGLADEVVAGQRPADVLPGEIASFVTGNFQRCVNAGRNLSYEEVVSLPSGKRVLLTQLAPIRDEQGRIYLLAGISRDMTDERKNQEALRQAQKLESLGVLAGGIAHDFNNLLTAILGNLNLAQMKLAAGAPADTYLQNMESTILRAADLTRQMLAYSGKGRFVVKPLDLSRMVEEITHLLSVSISKKVTLRYELASGLPAVEADGAQIQQVIMNLVTNASEAIGDREGIITITTGTRDLDQSGVERLFVGQTLQPGRFVTLQVSDTGCGMKPEVLARIFDPFFTTKTSGRGLGLSAMLGILRGHGGGIKIYSELGKGSVFQVYLRASEAPAQVLEVASSEQDQGFHGVVLLVDDEPDLRTSIAAMLAHLGFQVETAGDGQEALERFVPGRFALVLMDLTMPKLDGREAFRRMKELDPAVKVILSSGYNEQDAIQQLLGHDLAGFIQKPYQVKALIEVLRKTLESGKP